VNFPWLVLTHGVADFPVTEYGGTKSILISTRTVMGGKNPFMGIAYIVVGGICIVLGTLFTVAHLFRPRYFKACHSSKHTRIPVSNWSS
jgi:hypothetical protein